MENLVKNFVNAIFRPAGTFEDVQKAFNEMKSGLSVDEEKMKHLLVQYGYSIKAERPRMCEFMKNIEFSVSGRTLQLYFDSVTTMEFIAKNCYDELKRYIEEKTGGFDITIILREKIKESQEPLKPIDKEYPQKTGMKPMQMEMDFTEEKTPKSADWGNLLISQIIIEREGLEKDRLVGHEEEKQKTKQEFPDYVEIGNIGRQLYENIVDSYYQNNKELKPPRRQRAKCASWALHQIYDKGTNKAQIHQFVNKLVANKNTNSSLKFVAFEKIEIYDFLDALFEEWKKHSNN